MSWLKDAVMVTAIYAGGCLVLGFFAHITWSVLRLGWLLFGLVW